MNELPPGWAVATLDQVATWGSGGTPSRRNPAYYGGDIPWVKTGELGQRSVQRTEEAITELGLKHSSAKIFPTGSVAIAMYGATIGKTSILDIDAATNQACAVGIPHEELTTKEYIFHYLCSQKDAFIEAGKGGAQPNISQAVIKKWKIPLAPLNEQKRIADKLDAVLARVDACREHLDRMPAILKCFRQAVLAAAYTGELTTEFRSTKRLTPVAETLAVVQHPSRPNRYSSRTDAVIDGDYALAVGNPGRVIPDGWQWVPLVDIARMESGHTPSRAHPEYWDGDVPWIGIADARDWHGKTIPCTYQHTNEAGLANSAARLLPTDTVCLSRTASVGYVVRMGVPMATSQDFANWICTRAIDPDWLKFLFVAETEAIYRFGKGSTHTTVYFPELMAFHVALPPIEEQHEIVRRVEALFAYADRLETRYTAARAQVERLTPVLLAKAFRGELVPQDPNDEPASVLLERIRSSRAAAGKKPPRKVRTERKPMPTTPTTDTLKEIIRGLPTDQFTFDDLRRQVSADYETLKDLVFALLSEAPASIKQVFDTEAKTMRLVRVK